MQQGYHVDYTNKLGQTSLVPSRKQRKQKANTKESKEHC